MIKQGDIFWFLLEEPNDFSSEYPHPHVVVQDHDINHSHHNTVMLCALTTNMKKVNLPRNILLEIGEANLAKQSIVDVSQVIKIEKLKLGEYIGSLSEQRISQVLEGIKFLQRMTEKRK
ncbi:MAG: type II toxin-antitoxin system PemK/MazF family toxin [Anaerolineae bacterium]|nr:type II toxin-antitoxin system PemK/MazF family toxin [Anaerolineae bacterium]MBT7191269.1 type II toxin-antitoxin system PemK/MazF family toxin [Anaerolineae bacterium]MBT7992013.1 type II toxin-antitoxin system PemK/MazF family toxin [Anaerolineae bacterium]